MPTRIQTLGLLLLALLGLFSACGPASSPVTPTPPASPATATPPPSPTPPPTATRPPTATTRPTATPEPTVPTSPTPTVEPSATPVPTAEPTSTPAATATPEIVLAPIGDLPSLAGQEVTVQGTVVWASSFSQGFKFLLDDGTGRATLLMWLNVYDDCWDAADLRVGAIVRAHGTVDQYEGEWQVQAGYGGDVKVVSPRAAPPLRQIGTITADDVTTLVTIEGTVSQAEAFSQGQRVYVDDGTGTLMVLLWQNVFERVPDSALLLTPGTRVRVDGVVEEYRGTLELVPQVPYSVVVLSAP